MPIYAVYTKKSSSDCDNTSMQNAKDVIHCKFTCIMTYEPRHEKNGLRVFRPGPVQTGLKFRITTEKVYYLGYKNKGANWM